MTATLSPPCAAPVTIRPLRRPDAGRAVDTIFAALSPQSRYLRFHSPIPHLVASLRARLVDIDGYRRVAVVAEADGIPVGIARLAGDGHGTADTAVAVADAWHRRGIGRCLLSALADLATEIGYTQLRGSVVPGNVAMLTLARRMYPHSRRHFDGDAIELLVPIGPAAATVTADDVTGDPVRVVHVPVADPRVQQDRGTTQLGGGVPGGQAHGWR